MAKVPLSAASLVETVAASLPKGSDPLLNSPYDAVALFCHACMINVGFKLVGLGEDHRIETDHDVTHPGPLPTEWNASSTYAFRYTHPQSSMQFLIKVSRLGSKAVVFGLGLGDDKTASFDVAVGEFLSPNSFPLSSSDTEGAGTELSQKLQGAFITSARIADLAALFKISIIQKLAPSLHKPGYEEDFAEERSTASPSNPQGTRQPPPQPGLLPSPARPQPYGDPLAEAPRRPFPPGEFAPPGFEDEYEINRPPRNLPGLVGGGGRNPVNIGADDLYPPGLAPHDPLRPSFGPGGGGRFGGGGMHPTFDDPLFGGPRGDPSHGRAPPGARYDPVGPNDGPPFGSGARGRGYPGGEGGGPGNPFGGFGSGDFI